MGGSHVPDDDKPLTEEVSVFARLLNLFRKPAPVVSVSPTPTYEDVIAERDRVLASGQFWIPTSIQFEVLLMEDERIKAEEEANKEEFTCCDESWF